MSDDRLIEWQATAIEAATYMARVIRAIDAMERAFEGDGDVSPRDAFWSVMMEAP